MLSKPPKIIDRHILKKLKSALGLFFVSSFVRGLGAVAAIVVASFEGTSPQMDCYIAFGAVTSAICALVATPALSLVANQLRNRTDQPSAHAVSQTRAWAQSMGIGGTGIYLVLCPLFALLFTPSDQSIRELWMVLLLGVPCVYAAAQVATEQALLQASGKAYLAVLCSGLMTGTALVFAIVGKAIGGLYVCLLGVAIGAWVELLITRRIANTVYARMTPSSTREASVRPEPYSLARVPWANVFVLMLAAGGVLLSSFMDQALIARMGSGVQAAYGLASRPSSFLALAIFGAGSVLVTTVVSARPEGGSDAVRERIFELFYLMLGLSVAIQGALWIGAEVVTRVLYERGAFGSVDTLRVSAVLPFAAIAYVAYPATAILLRGVSAASRTRALLVSSGVYLTMKSVLGVVLVGSLGLGAIAISSMAAAAGQGAVLWYSLARSR